MSATLGDRLRSTTVVVVNWNLPDLTTRCVRALVDDGIPAERVVIVENGSNEASTAALRETLEGCLFCRLDSNIGYARAANMGAGALEGATYLFVNNDAFVHRPGSIAKLVERVGQDGVAVAVPRLLNEDLTLQPSVVPLPTPARTFVQASGLGRFLPDRWQPSWSHHWAHGESREITAAVATVMAIRTEAWQRLGGWVERELMFAEDIDLCWRAGQAGWRIWFEGEAEFVHLGNQSGRQLWSDPGREEQVARASRAMIFEALPPRKAGATIFFLQLGMLLRLVYFVITRNRAAAAALRGGLRGYHRSVP
jgi:GT2 family glycosyltransferase